jgi:hypothetical protein
LDKKIPKGQKQLIKNQGNWQYEVDLATTTNVMWLFHLMHTCVCFFLFIRMCMIIKKPYEAQILFLNLWISIEQQGVKMMGVMSNKL